jgi:magnesium-transporting ATPase (P-type)
MINDERENFIITFSNFIDGLEQYNKNIETNVENKNNMTKIHCLLIFHNVIKEFLKDNSLKSKKEIYFYYWILIHLMRFDFSSKLQRMVVICKNISENFFKVFCKGSPEKIKELCDPSTIPESYDETLNIYTTRGYRVLGMAAKGLTMSFEQTQTVKRQTVEKNMLFLGFLIVQNKLKEKTMECLEKFDNADLRMMMATGDNILTAICVSKDCNLIRQNQEMVSCYIENVNGMDKLKWEKLEDDRNHDMSNELDNSKKDLLINGETMGDNERLLLNKHLIDKTSNTLYDLYPPENINSAEFRKEPVHKKKYQDQLL